MGVNADYFSATIMYLSALNGEKPEAATFKGKDSYLFHCPFCTQYVYSKEARNRRTAKFIRERDNSWNFTCSRGYSIECRGGVRSMHNFLLLLNPDLFREYQFSLAWTDNRNHKELKRFKNS